MSLLNGTGIRADKYLKSFISYCKEKFGKNLTAIVIYGSYAWGYFDSKRSDYDVFVILSEKIDKPEIERKQLMKKFPKVSVQYLVSGDELIQRAHFGHWTSYITLLTSAKVLYSRKKKYKNLLKDLKGINLLEKLADVTAIELKTQYELRELKKNRGFKAIKWSVPVIRKRLQMLTFLKSGKLVWSLNKNLKRNKRFLSRDEIIFIRKLNKKMYKRSEDFKENERANIIKIVDKMNGEILRVLTNLEV